MSCRETPRDAVDNDILIKAACYRLHSRLLATRFAVLGAARFVVRARLGRMPLDGDRSAVQDAAAELMNRAVTLEPSEGELAVAVELETVAQRRGLELDAGESQLAAIVAKRRLARLMTGDKRAIRALDQLVDEVPTISALGARVWSLEQLVEHLVDAGEPADEVARAICAEPTVDKTLTICARCHSPPPYGPALDRDALRGYIERLRMQAARVLGR